MKYKVLNNTVCISRKFIEHYLKEGQTALDATVGNGNDTMLIAEKVGKKGKVYGFDIQGIAIENTKKLLKKNNLLDRVELINDSHKNLNKIGRAHV